MRLVRVFPLNKMAAGGSDPSAIQLQLRRNADEMKDYLKDLGQWEDEIKKKEAYIIKQKPILKKSVPPVRGQQPIQKRKKIAVVEGSGREGGPNVGGVAQPQRIRSYDYQSWDKFDVDKACTAVDEASSEENVSEEEEEGEEEGSGEEEAIEEQRRRQRAVLEKEKGNDLFREGKFEAAIEHYSFGMVLDPHNAMLAANRAMALLKVERFAAAEADCSLAISVDDTYSKAFFRRGVARAHLGKLTQAVEDFEKVLELEPGNKQSKTELQKCRKKIAEKEKAGTKWKRKDGVEAARPMGPHVRPVKRPPHQRSQKPLRRIAIEEIGGEPADSGGSALSSSVEEPSCDPARGRQQEGSDMTGAAKSSGVTPLGSAGVEEVAVEPEVEGGSGSQTEELTAKKTSQAQSGLSPSLSPPSLDGAEAVRSPTSASLPAGVATAESASGEVVPPPAVPSTSLQFVADWKELRGDEGRMLAYLKQLPVACYPKVLQQSLETDVFSSILRLLRDHYVRQGQSCLKELKGLTLVQRFSVGVMFLSSAGKEVVREIFTELQSLCPGEAEEINSLRKCYRT